MGSTPRLISASRGAATLGVSGWATPLSVWQEIEEELHPGFNAARGYALPEREESAAMRWGTAFESSIIGLAERASGKRIADREMAYLHDDNEDITL
jgi:predicted phage-related endonuclease